MQTIYRGLMNEKDSQEIAYRRQAFKLFDKEKSAAEILALIPRSRAWLFKWKQRFEQEGWQALDSLSKAPLNSPQQHSAQAVNLVIRIRQRMEKRKVGLVGAFEIQQEIRRKRLLKSVPSLASIKRWLRNAGLVDAEPEPEAAAYYPAIQQPQEFVILSCDWLARYLRGGEKVFVFHTINLCSHALSQMICSDKTTASAYAHLLQCFAQLGLPDFLQIDNDAAFTGLSPHQTSLWQNHSTGFVPGHRSDFHPARGAETKLDSRACQRHLGSKFLGEEPLCFPQRSVAQEQKLSGLVRDLCAALLERDDRQAGCWSAASSQTTASSGRTDT